MSIENGALFYQTDLITWSTPVPIDTITRSPRPPIVSSQRDKSSNYFYYFRRFLHLSSDRLLDRYSWYQCAKSAWKFALSPDGRSLVVVKNNNIELRWAAQSEWSPGVVQCQPIQRDLYPQWRCVAWSAQSNYVCVSFSNGTCDLWDTHGSRLALALARPRSPIDPVVALVVLESAAGKSRVRVAVVTLAGSVFLFDIRHFRLVAQSEARIESLAGCPVLCGAASVLGNHLVLGTYSRATDSSGEPRSRGLLFCRLVDESPFILAADCSRTAAHQSESSWFSGWFEKPFRDGVCRLELSRNERKLAALHLSGRVSVWSFPAMGLIGEFSPHSTLPNPVSIGGARLNDFDQFDASITDLCWWNSEFLSVGLQNGRVLILNEELTEIDSVFLSPFPQLRESVDKSFFALNCVAKSIDSPKSSLAKTPASSSNSPIAWRMFNSCLNYLWPNDNVNAISVNKSVDMCSLRFQLSCFKLTTPTELFEIEINKQRYAEALLLAEKYDLDSDLVFQKQWRNSSKSIEDIRTILIKIKKRNWILNECIERIPNQIESMKCLLRLGLKLTRFIDLSSEEIDLEDIEYEIGDQQSSWIEREDQIDDISIHNDFNLTQIELVRIRLKLFSYCDKLSIYEKIIDQSSTKFSRDTFAEFKSLSPFELSIKFANSGNIIGLEVCLEFHYSRLRPHVLVILSNIPECISPSIYAHLFAKFPINPDHQLPDRHQRDWCESERFREIYEEIFLEKDAENFYYENHRDQSDWILSPNQPNNFRSIFTNWMTARIRKIESETLNVEYACELLKIAIDFGLEIDSKLQFDLRFLNEAVYHCQTPNAFLGLSEFEVLSDLDKAKVLLSNPDSESFLYQFSHRIVPFLEAIHCPDSQFRSREFLHLYLQYLAVGSLNSVGRIFRDKDCLKSILKSIELSDLVRIFLAIILNDDNPDHLVECSNISRSISSFISLSKSKSKINKNDLIAEGKQLQEISDYVTVLKMMEKYGMKKSLKFIHENRFNTDLVENLITNIVFQYLKSIKSLDESVFKSVFSEIQTALSLVFKTIHPKLIYRNLLKSLLESGEAKKIQFAAKFMDLSKTISIINSDDKLLDYFESSECVSIAAQNYLNTSTSTRDENFRLAKCCLNLLQGDCESSSIKFEWIIVKSCEFLEKHHCSVVPIEMRSKENRLDLLAECLNTDKSLYRNLEQVIEAASFLFDERKPSDRKYHEGEALRLVANKSIENNDIENLEIVMNSLVHRNHKPCWNECIKCLKITDYPIERRHVLGQYAITHCPKSVLYEAIKLMRELEIESINLSSSTPATTGDTNLIKQPIRFISSNLTDITARLSLKSLIDKSSDTIMKLSNQVTILSGQRANENREFLFGKNNSDSTESLDRMTFHSIYNRHSNAMNNTITIDEQSKTELETLVNLLSVYSSSICETPNQTQLDQIHLKLVQYNLNRDTYLSIIHSVFIDDLNLIHNLRYDGNFRPNLFNRALVLTMVQFNLVFKYSGRLPVNNRQEKIDFQSIFESKLSPTETEMLKSMTDEYNDYLLIDKISTIRPGISVSRFFSSVDYREEIVSQLSEYQRDSVDSYRYSLALADRYGIDRRIVSWKYLISFLSTIDNTNFDESVNRFHSVFDWNSIMSDENSLRNDLEGLLVNEDSPNRLEDFRVVLNVFQRIDRSDFVLFDRSVSTHIGLIDLFDSIFINSQNCCNYLDFFVESHQSRIIDALKRVVNVDNLHSCSQLMAEYQLSNEFSKIKNDFSTVLANQTLWSKDLSSVNNGNEFVVRFQKSLNNFSSRDYENFKDFLCWTLFKKSNSYISLQLKIDILKIGEKFIGKFAKCQENSQESVSDEWSKVTMEISIWLDHIENTVRKVINQLNSLENISRDLVEFAEYLPPENYWDCLMNEMLFSGISYQDFFTFTWDLSIESIIVEEVIATHICHLVLSKFVSKSDAIKKLIEIFDELDEFLDSQSVQNIMSIVLSNPNVDNQTDIIHWLLNEIVFRSRRTKSHISFDINSYIVSIFSQWKLSVNKKLEISKTSNLFIIDALIQDCDSPDRMASIAGAIKLIELINEENNLWQCWVKSCIIKGSKYWPLVYDEFCDLKQNKLYKERFQKLSKDAVQSLTPFNPSDAISLLILQDPIESVNQIQTILVSIKYEPAEYANTMKSIDKKSLKIIVDLKLVPLYAKTFLFQRLVNFITKEMDDPDTVQDVLEQLKQNGLHDEATWLASSSTHINPAMKTIEMVSGLWKRFSTG